MNPRILKKLSKRADPYVQQLTQLERFVVDGGQVDSAQKVDRKHLIRWGGTPNRYGYFEAKNGTVGYGGMSGYYDPEWEEKDAYTHLMELVADRFTDWQYWDEESYPKPTIRIKTPCDVFAHADALLAPNG